MPLYTYTRQKEETAWKLAKKPEPTTAGYTAKRSPTHVSTIPKTHNTALVSERRQKKIDRQAEKKTGKGLCKTVSDRIEQSCQGQLTSSPARPHASPGRVNFFR
jgi:hypothetical protein